MYQQFLHKDIDGNPVIYKTTDGTNRDVIFEHFADEGSWNIKNKTCGKFKLIIGYYYYKIEKELDKDDGIGDISYVPKSEKIKYKGEIYYKTSNYKIDVHIIITRGQEFDVNWGHSEGAPINIDVLELVEIKVDPIAKTIKKPMEKNILYVKHIDKSIDKVSHSIFIDKTILKNELEGDKNKVANKDPDHKIIKNPLNKLIDINGKKIFITREIDTSFVLIEIKNFDKYIFVENLKINKFVEYRKMNNIIKYRPKEFKKRVPEYKKVLKLISDLSDESEDSDS